MPRLALPWLRAGFLVSPMALGLTPGATLGQDATPQASALPAGVSIVANGLDNPRGFTWDDDGTIHLALAGIGGPSMGMIEGAESGLTGGPTGSVVSLADGCATVVAGDLPSSLWEGVGWVWGPADVAYLDGQLYQLAGGGGSDFGNFDTPSGVYRVNADGSSTLVGNFAAWSREHQPELIPPDYNADGSLNDMFADGELLWVVDAVGGRIVTVTPDGEITLFKDMSQDHPVPTSLVPDGEGGLYVANLTAIPYPNGSATVVQIAADGAVADIWTGLTAITSLAMGPDGTLYASEMATNTIEEEPFLTPDNGTIVRQTGPQSSEPVVNDLAYPVSIGFGGDGALYISTPAFGAGAGAGLGALLRVDPDASMPVSFAGVDLSAPVCASGSSVAATTSDASAMEDLAAPAAESTALVRIPLEIAATDARETLGISRMTIDAGGSGRAMAGSGPSLLYIEEGALLIAPAETTSPFLVFSASEDAAAGSEVDAGQETLLETGTALLLPAGSETGFRNDGEAPVALLTLLAARDARADAEVGVTRSVLANAVDVAALTGLLTLGKRTIPSGERLDFPAAPVQTVAAGIDRRQAMLLSGRMDAAAVNRSDGPVEIFLLTLEPMP